MSKKRPLQDDEQLNTNEPAEFQNEGRAKRAKLTSPTDTTIEDLPMELLDNILVETVTGEVMDRKLVRSAWKEAADRVVDRLKKICPIWDKVLTTEFFRKKLHSTLDSFPSVQISLKVVAKQWIASCVAVAILNDEVFMLCQPVEQQHVDIVVYVRNNLKKEKTKIPLNQVRIPWNLVACSVTNCLYVLYQAASSIEILRVSKGEHSQFQVSPWITCSTQLVSKMSIAADGSLILYQGPAPSTITVYNSDGTVIHQMDLAKPISSLHDIIAKSNGNFILASGSLTEIDREGNVVNEHGKSSYTSAYYAVGKYDWMMTVDEGGHVTLLDSEFNQWDVDLGLDWDDNYRHIFRVQYDRKRNEFVIFECSPFSSPAANRPTQRLSIVAFTESTIPKDAQKL